MAKIAQVNAMQTMKMAVPFEKFILENNSTTILLGEMFTAALHKLNQSVVQGSPSGQIIGLG